MLPALGVGDLSSNLSDPMRKCDKMKVVALDMMGVIFKEGHIIKNLLSKIFPNVSYLELRGRYDRYVVGQITNKQFWEGITSRPGTAEREFLDKIEIDDDFEDVAPYLRAKYYVAIVSDCTEEWKKYLVEKFKLKNFIDEILISADIGYSKPGKEIFQAFLERVKIPANECCYIDDRLDSLETAKSLGMTTIWYEKEPPTVWFKPDYKIKKLKELINII